MRPPLKALAGGQVAQPDRAGTQQTITFSGQGNAGRARRAQVLRSCGATWRHLHALGLTSELVADTLRKIIRESNR